MQLDRIGVTMARQIDKNVHVFIESQSNRPNRTEYSTRFYRVTAHYTSVSFFIKRFLCHFGPKFFKLMETKQYD